ncbi:solute carrier family 22 member 6-like [Biomphalaria glabrata]|uniref:Solute carrier family 22 member 6-like n=1 Tax=Biomphalaria glabrata TaxID=6526 RepID=A0A9W3B1C8_BIOGL|nr:solute carrier family 22 member 6-like [Biomphalaria glabrata]XP_055893271.1 solute carrier family 22 member 6-like [Biomphalaria glabrata]
MEKLDVLEEIWISLKWNGLYQKTRFVVLLLPVVALVVQNYSVVFIGKSVGHRCRQLRSLNVTIDGQVIDLVSNYSSVHLNVSYEECTIDVLNSTAVVYSTHCIDGYSYLEDDVSTFVPEWDLVCERRYLSDASQTIYVVGQMVGVLLTRFADTHGRRVMYLVSSMLSCFASIASAFATNYEIYLAANFITGIFVLNSYQLAGIIVLEMMPKSRRALPEQVQSVLWSASLLLLCFLAFITRHLSWRYVQVILSLTTLYMLFQPWVIDESLRWLYVTKQYKKAEQLIRKIARINKVDPQRALDVFNKSIMSESQSLAQQSDVENIKLCEEPNTNVDIRDQKLSTKESSLLMFFKNRNLLKVTAITSFLLLVDVFAYEGLIMISQELTPDFYLGFTLAALTDFPAAVLFILLINRIGRKRSIGLLHLLAGTLLLMSTLLLHTSLSDRIPGNFWMSVVLSLLGRLTLSAGYSSVLLYVPELFPTSIRNTGYALALLMSYFASMVSPYSRSLSKLLPWAPNVVFGVMCVTLPVAIRRLPETMNKELPQTLADMDRNMRKAMKKS